MTATCSTAPEDDVRLRRSWALSERTAQRTLQQLLRQQQNLLDGGARGGNSYQSQELLFRIARRALTALAREAMQNKRIR